MRVRRSVQTLTLSPRHLKPKSNIKFGLGYFYDKEKYKVVNELYGLFGKIFEVAQYIEWNIALISSKSQHNKAKNMFENMQEMTMGQIVNIARGVEYFENEDIEELEYILNKRNYLAHQFFKQNDIVKHKENSKFIDNKIRELNNILN